MIDVTTTFVAKGCQRRRPHVVACSRRIATFAFASAGDICTAHLQEEDSQYSIVNTTAAHESPITCLKFAKWVDEPDGYERVDYIIVGSADGSFTVWIVTHNEAQIIECALFSKLEGKAGGAITYCAGAVHPENTTSSSIFLTSAYSVPDGTLHVRSRSLENYFEPNESEAQISFAPDFALCFDFHLISPGTLIIAVGCSNFTVEIVSVNISEKALMRVLTLHGHTDWISSIAIKEHEGDALLASAGQDNLIRLWRFSANKQSVAEGDAYESHGAPESEVTLRPQIINLQSGDGCAVEVSVRLEAVLGGHDAWVHSLQWHSIRNQLLSVSSDKCLILWEPSEMGGGVWLEKVRVGDVGGQAVGYYGGCYSPAGTMIIAHSYFGGFYAWSCKQECSDDNGFWEPRPLFGGHSMAVCDLCWDPSGSYLLSCSLDQTTRCFAPCATTHSYAEIARPQVHGYDLACIASVSTSCFVSGAEEKILRAFRAPKTFARSLANISACEYEQLFPDTVMLAEQGASVPALGLSNKEIGEDPGLVFGLGGTADELASLVAYPVVLEELPTEDHLMQNTLWPEIHKLYGHGFEVFSVAVNHTGAVIATACRASQRAHASIMLWDTDRWERHAELLHHQLTVTQLEFSPDDSMLLSVSRDRTFALFSQLVEGPFNWKLIGTSPESGNVHSRIIWSCSWSADNKYFATGARDRKLAIWSVSRHSEEVKFAMESKRFASVTAVAFCALILNGCYVLAIGLEDGRIEIVSWDPADIELSVLICLNRSLAHSQTVRRLRFRPVIGEWSPKGGNAKRVCELASAGNDNAVKVHRLHFT
uniref:Elongator complex protein 2 n=2 Tax=Ascaris TaxID=6251 RepID=F1KSV1_ASCSU